MLTVSDVVPVDTHKERVLLELPDARSTQPHILITDKSPHQIYSVRWQFHIVREI